MRAFEIVPSEPMIDDDLSLIRCREPLDIENLPAQSSIESFVVSIFLR